MKFQFRLVSVMKKFTLTVFLHFICLLDNSKGLSGPACDPVENIKPYVQIFEQRNGPPLESLHRSGFLDLSKYIHKSLCVNGVAVMYEENVLAGPLNTSKIFTSGDVEIFYHECTIINKISTNKAIEIRDAGNFYPTLDDVQSSDIMGKRVTGIYLISEPLDFYLTTSVMFIQSNFNYIITDEDSVRNGSFVTVGTGPFCLSVNDDTYDIVLRGKNLKETSVCRWTIMDGMKVLPVFKKRYDIVFNGSLTRYNLSWHACGPNSGSGGSGLGPYPQNLNISTTPAPRPAQVDPFSIIDPRMWSSKGRKRPKLTASEFDLGNQTKDVEPDFTDEELLEDFYINMDPSMCIQLRSKLDTPDTACKTDPVDEKAACEILDIVLTMEQDPPDTSRPPMRFEENLEWKNEIMDLVAEIFGKICEPFSKTMPFTIGRIVAYYLARAHNVDPNIRTTQREVWKFLKSELQRCNDGITKPMLWYWDNREDLITPQIVECKIESCSFGCSVNEVGDKCEVPGLVDCSNSFPVCHDDGCIFDQPSKICVHDDPTHNCVTPRNCDSPFCTIDETTWTCKEPICNPITCLNPSVCIVSGQKECLDKNLVGGNTDGGAFPSSADFSSILSELDLVGSGGTGIGGGGSGGTGTTVPLASPFKVINTQEVIHPRQGRNYNFLEYPVNILVITQILKKIGSEDRETNIIEANTTIVGECLFFYEDQGQHDYELNIAIDIHFKIWTTVIGYCNNFYHLRKSETFPRLYNTYYEDFLEHIINDWKSSKDNEYLRTILSEFNSEVSQRWLDTCLESSYYISNSTTYRPPRPLTIGEDGLPQSNFFVQIPDFIGAKFHQIDISKPNQTVKCP